MSKLKLTLACGNYDRTRALMDGTVQPEGIDLNYLPLIPGETFWRMLNNGEFDVSEMSLSSYTILRSKSDERFIALPVFPLSHLSPLLYLYPFKFRHPKTRGS